MTTPPSLFASGRFSVGCNYWASHAGMMMWRDWRPEVVDEDMRQLAAEGLQVLRVFPLWPDFQPLHQLYTGMGRLMELRFGEDPLPDHPVGRAGVSREALEKFRFLADRAQENGLQLVVGLVTGWMSGRLFVPPAFEGRNVITDPLVQRWQMRFVDAFVRAFRDHPAVTAWDLGNECNCMGPVNSADQAFQWTAMIAGAIRLADPDKPIVSGMHSLAVSRDGNWNLHDQGELTDILTTHPYPIFTPHCNQDPIHHLRNGFHAAAESRLYADMGGRPCFAEEMGSLGPMVASEAVTAAYTRSALYTLWAQDCRAMLWWCAYDQDQLDFSPYDSGDCERELGLIRSNREAKPALAAIRRFREEIESLPIDELPPCRREAVCILGDRDDAWGAAYSSFILAKQAGFDLSFQHANEPLRDAPLYLCPSLGRGRIHKRLWRELLERVRTGAVLYVSLGDVFVQPFARVFGLEIDHREKSVGSRPIHFQGLPGAPVLPGSSTFRLCCHAMGAEVLGVEEDGNVALARHAVGKGYVIYLSFPMETMLSDTPGAFHGPGALPYYRIYQFLAAPILAARLLRVEHPTVTVTEHPLGDGTCVAVVINHAPDPVTAPLEPADGWTIAATWIGANRDKSGTLDVPGNDATVLLLAPSSSRAG